jgi:hypothetical protein
MVATIEESKADKRAGELRPSARPFVNQGGSYGMKKLFVLAVSVCALAGLGVAGAATADNGAVTTPFKASYQNGNAWYTCSGANIQKTGPKAFNKDSETCLASTDDGLYPVGTTTYGPGVWASDYFFFTLNQFVIDQTVTITKVANGDGTFTLSIVAYY